MDVRRIIQQTKAITCLILPEHIDKRSYQERKEWLDNKGRRYKQVLEEFAKALVSFFSTTEEANQFIFAVQNIFQPDESNVFLKFMSNHKELGFFLQSSVTDLIIEAANHFSQRNVEIPQPLERKTIDRAERIKNQGCLNPLDLAIKQYRNHATAKVSPENKEAFQKAKEEHVRSIKTLISSARGLLPEQIAEILSIGNPHFIPTLFEKTPGHDWVQYLSADKNNASYLHWPGSFFEVFTIQYASCAEKVPFFSLCCAIYRALREKDAFLIFQLFLFMKQEKYVMHIVDVLKTQSHDFLFAKPEKGGFKLKFFSPSGEDPRPRSEIWSMLMKAAKIIILLLRLGAAENEKFSEEKTVVDFIGSRREEGRISSSKKSPTKSIQLLHSLKQGDKKDKEKAKDFLNKELKHLTDYFNNLQKMEIDRKKGQASAPVETVATRSHFGFSMSMDD